MLIGKNYTYLELQKSGSSFVENLLLTLDSNTVQYPRHISLAKIERRGIPIGHKQVISNIRNPWSWYVSLWSYGCQGQGGFFNRKEGTHWLELYEDVNDPKLFKKWLHMVLWGPASELRERFHKVAWNEMVGFYTYRYLKLGCRNLDKVSQLSRSEFNIWEFVEKNDIRTHYFRTEQLTQEVITNAHLFDLIQSDVESYIGSLSGKTNKSNHLQISSYYDDESFNWVLKKDDLICKKFEYFEIPQDE